MAAACRPAPWPPGKPSRQAAGPPCLATALRLEEQSCNDDYRAFFIPTAPGSYSFHFTGTIKGQKVDQTFKSGPQSFSDIEDPAQVQYPVQQPTGGQLATRADRETARVNAALTAERDQAKDDAASARTLAIIGLVVGILGLVAGGVALARGRRPAAPADTTVRS